ncbi:hypothetical protein QWY14_02515 [Planococcus sp. N028]|uniref:Uncharacterized protein n=1 Tax=Planococcus shixiaomingii TaxID=3058393 RepID=A0ABT8MYC2_9BACL|nr:hypothetical protein [Planococcus sp. N028]MDN7240641.1 hypothetical protein [Planococcus sp. N028]
MKKKVLISIGIGIVLLSSYVLLSNGFHNIGSIEVQRFDRETNELMEEKIITDTSAIKGFTKILNRANRDNNVSYEMSRQEDYRINVLYENGETDVFLGWNQEGVNILLPRTTTNDVFRIENKKHIKGFLEIVE